MVDFKSLSKEELDAYYRAGLAQLAKVDSPDGFEAFYELVFGLRLPRHCREWVDLAYHGREERKGLLVRAFRGANKTTTITRGFTAFRVGHEPTKSNLLIQVGEGTVEDNTSSIARIISDNPGWKLAFPNIVPDIEKGWGAGGYEVKDTSIPPEKWSEMNATRSDPTFFGVTYSSRAIIGRHPNGLLIIDDIHDENNTSSEKELAGVLKRLNGTILKTRVDSTWMIAIGTPWVEGDALDYLEKTGMFVTIKTPIYKEVAESNITFNGTPIELTWSEVKTLQFVEEEYSSDLTPGKIEFYRMMLLDLTKIQHRIFMYQTYKNADISAVWPMTVGCDYAGTMDEKKNRLGDNDYFCLAYVMKNPMGGAIVYDGVRERTTQSQAEQYVLAAQSMFRGHMLTVVEGDGKGEEFIQVIRRNPGLKLLALKTGGHGKAKRFERVLQPALASGQVRISDADTPFLNALRKELADYPNGKHDDTLDAVYWALRGMPDVLVGQTVFEEQEPMAVKKRQPNPFIALARA